MFTVACSDNREDVHFLPLSNGSSIQTPAEDIYIRPTSIVLTDIH